jgi:cysteinyl-tRNA synthetase
MSFRLHDSLSNAVIPLPQRTPGETSLYVCGPTVYGYIHVGNARPPVVFDVLVRHLERQGNIVRYVRNFTDVDDKIIQVALDTGEAPRVITDRYIDAYREDVGALLCRPPWAEPRVSENIVAIIAHIEALIAKGFAYVTADGDVYYDTATFVGYGSSPSVTSTTSAPPRGAARPARASAANPISRSGSRPRRTNPTARGGLLRGAKGDRGGTSSARRWRTPCSAPASTFTAADKT